MAIRIRISEALAAPTARELELEPAPADVGSLIRMLEARFPGLGQALDSSSVNAVVNGEVILQGRDATRLADGDDVEFLVMFAGG